MMTNKLRIFLAITSTSSSLLIFNCLPAIALAPSSGFDANGIDRDVNTDMWEDENEDNPGTVGSPLNHQKMTRVHLERLNQRLRTAFWILRLATIVNTQFPTIRVI